MTELTDDFKGDTAHLIRSIEALLSMDAAGVLSHRVGGHARTLLSAAANRLAGAVAAPSGVPAELLNQAQLLCEWIAESPHQRGSINGAAAQLHYAISSRPAAPSGGVPADMVQQAIAGLDYFLMVKEDRRFIEGARAALTSAAPAQSADMVLVPREPTQEMWREAGRAAREYMEETGGNSPTVIYKAMIAAAAGAPTKTADEHAGMPSDDAKRFEWYFGDKPKGDWLMTYLDGMRTGWTTDQWRAAIDAAMQNSVHEAAPQASEAHSGSAPANAPSGEGSAQ